MPAVAVPPESQPIGRPIDESQIVSAQLVLDETSLAETRPESQQVTVTHSEAVTAHHSHRDQFQSHGANHFSDGGRREFPRVKLRAPLVAPSP